jgi:hypothetical protein
VATQKDFQTSHNGDNYTNVPSPSGADHSGRAV